MSNSLLFANGLHRVFASLMHSLLVSIFFVVTLLCSFSIAQARAGDLDPSYSDHSITKFNSSYGGISDTAIQSNGKLIVVGSIEVGFNNSLPPGWYIIIVRYNINGTLDATFGNGGIFYFNPNSINSDIGGASASSVAIQSDGKIVVGGEAFMNERVPDWNLNSDFFLAGFNSNGSLDTSFGNNGVVTTDFDDHSYDVIKDIVIAQDGKIIAVGGGCGHDEYPLVSAHAIARYQINGTLDQTFGDGGRLVDNLTIFETHSYHYGERVEIEPETNKLIVSGVIHEAQMILTRYLPHGERDQSFGESGSVFVDGAYIFAPLALQEDGKILVGTYKSIFDETTGSFNDQVALLYRYDSSGSLDTGFGSNGVASVDMNQPYNFFPRGILVQTDGKIIFTPGSGIILRFTSSGVLDESFGNFGFVYTSPNPMSAILQSDGRLVVASSNIILGKLNLIIARYLTDDGQPSADLQITASAPQSVLEGETINYFFRLTNNGSDVTTNVAFDTRLPAGTTFVSVTPNIGSCSGTTTITCSFGNLAAGRSRTINLIARANASAMFTTTARVTSDTLDYKPANNTANTKVTAGKLLLSLTPNVVYTACSNTSLARIRLSTPAPQGGAVVTLQSSNTAVATVPVNVQIPAGATSVEFNISVAGVTSEKRSDITAIQGSIQSKQTLIARPDNGIESFSYQPNPVVGGNQVTVTVKLACNVMSFMPPLRIRSSNLVAIPQDNLLHFSLGSRTASINVHTRPVISVQYPVISVTPLINGVTSNLTMRILP